MQVNPLEEDPWAIQIGHERIIAPGCTARLYGHHLEKVTGIVIANQTVTRLVQGSDDQGMYLEYQVPQEVTEGGASHYFIGCGWSGIRRRQSECEP